MINETTQQLNDTNSTCNYQPIDNLESKVVVLFCATFLCCLGAICNVVSVFAFARPYLRSTHNNFLAALALCDCGVLLCFVAIYTIEVLIDWMDSASLYFLWFSYAREVFFLAHAFKISSVYLTVCATVERFLATCTNKAGRVLCTRRMCPVYITMVITSAFGLSIIKYFELHIVTSSSCDDFGHYTFAQAPLTQNPIWIVYNVWISPFVTTFIPFLILLSLNVKTGYQLMRNEFESAFGIQYGVVNLMRRSEFLATNEGQRILSRRKDTTRVLVFVVAAFLICNAPDVVVTLIEHIDSEMLYNNAVIYSFLRDAINIITVIQASVNFYIYLTFGHEFRHELYRLIRSCCLFCTRKQRMNRRRKTGTRCGANRPMIRRSRMESMPKLQLVELICRQERVALSIASSGPQSQKSSVRRDDHSNEGAKSPLPRPSNGSAHDPFNTLVANILTQP